MSISRLKKKKIIQASYTVDEETGYYITEQGVIVDPETGEVIEDVTTKNKDWRTRLKDLMREEIPRASKDYFDDDYKNKWNKVSPVNVLVKDHINELYGMSPKQAKEYIIDFIIQMNQKYGHNDDTYSYFAQGQLDKMKMNLNKKKTIDQIIMYLYNVQLKGEGQGVL